MVRDFLATVTDEVLDEERRNPHNPAEAETVRSCLHVILEEELGNTCDSRSVTSTRSTRRTAERRHDAGGDTDSC